MSNDDFIWRFTPSRTDPELLEAIFVQREALLVDLLERVAESATTASKHHVLLIGPRGFGKTHLITLLNHRLSKDAAMSDRVRVAWLLEDETITSFVQLLKRIYEVLAQQYPVEFPLDWLQDLLTESPKRIRQQLEAKLVESFTGRTLLLCIENLDILFSGLGTSGQHDWRAFLQEHPFTTIIASTQRLFADVKSREKPFFGYFSPVPLEPLSVNDAVELLRRVAANRKATDLVAFLDTAEGRSRVRALHHLAGGNHRIYVVLSGFITRDSLDDLVGPFQKMADDLTPYYQERLRWLSPQQRQIIEYLCSQDYSCVPKQIARQLLATESTISSQLKKLLEIGYVLRSEAGRESRYELAEPLMRLASEVKEQQRRPLQLLVNFLRVWYRPEALPGLMNRAGTDSLRRHISAAIEDARINPDPRVRILIDAIAQARQKGKERDLLHALEEKAHTTDAATDWLELAYAQVQIAHDRFNALKSCNFALKLSPESPESWRFKGLILEDLEQYAQAIHCFDKAISFSPEDARPWNNKGLSLLLSQQPHQAISYFDHAIDLDPTLSEYLMNKSTTLLAVNRSDEALALVDRAIELDRSDARTWNNKGYVLHSLFRYSEAIECFHRAISICPELHAAWFNRADSFFAVGKFVDGIADLREVLQQRVFYHNGNVIERKLHYLLAAFAKGDDTSMQLLADLFAENELVLPLGEALVRSLQTIDLENTTHSLLNRWRDFWFAWGCEQPEMEVPLRLFCLGIDYLIKQDPKVLLDLVLSERQILGQVLGIEVS